jgi:DNA-binding transcriptional regulator PaaX
MSKLGNSSLKVLTWLYGASLVEERVVTSLELEIILPEMSPSGRRSLITQMKQKKLISLEKINNIKVFFLTSYGQKQLFSQFPALSPELDTWKGEWSIMVFLQSPNIDPQFRYLRQLLVDHHAGQLSRGVYLYPGKFPQEITHHISFYTGAVAIFDIKLWQEGDERSLISALFSLNDTIQALSGVGKEIDRLLMVDNGKKELMIQNASDFNDVFERLLSILEFDLGIHSWYFPQVKNSRDCLRKLQQPFLL